MLDPGKRANPTCPQGRFTYKPNSSSPEAAKYNDFSAVFLIIEELAGCFYSFDGSVKDATAPPNRSEIRSCGDLVFDEFFYVRMGV